MIREFGFQFDPFVCLDATKDERLYEYLVVPKTVEIAWRDEPVAILALPGGGKSALRVYTEQVYRGTRGVKLPITYVPESYTMDPQFHFRGIQRSLARALLIYLISYPDVFLYLPAKQQARLKNLLTFLPYEFGFLWEVLESSASIDTVEQLLGVNALSGIQRFGESHQRMISRLKECPVEPLEEFGVDHFFETARRILGINSFHILIDGLDGFVETTTPDAMQTWLKPLMDFAKSWASQKIFLKFFLPTSLAEFSHFASPDIQLVTLQWNDSLLAEIIRRRLYVASQGAFDSLDAISAPNVRNVELMLARQLNAEEKLPRQIIMKTRHLLVKASHHPNKMIEYADILEETRNVNQPTV
jgi:hypothetical protein